MQHEKSYFAGVALAIGLAASGCSHKAEAGRAMTVKCTITGEQHLPQPLSGTSICTRFSEATRDALDGQNDAEASVSVIIASPNVAKATLRVVRGGKTQNYPEQTVSIVDRSLNEQSITMLVNGTVSPLRVNK